MHDLMTIPANLAGLPALSVPVGLSAASKLPIGLQLMARVMDDDSLLFAGRALELANANTYRQPFLDAAAIASAARK